MSISSTQVLSLSPYELHRAAWLAMLNSQPGIKVAGIRASVDEIASLQPVSAPNNSRKLEHRCKSGVYSKQQ